MLLLFRLELNWLLKKMHKLECTCAVNSSKTVYYINAT